MIKGLLVEPESEYHAQAPPNLSSTLLKTFERCPLLYRRTVDGMVAPKDGKHFTIGSALHCRVLEGAEEFSKRFANDVGAPINPKTGAPYGPQTKAYTTWVNSLDRVVISAADHMQVCAMHKSVYLHPIARSLLKTGLPERVLRVGWSGHSCQIRVDWLTEMQGDQIGVCDIKTCQDLDFFERDMMKYNYFTQAGFYLQALQKATDRPLRWFFIAVEKSDPFRCGVWAMPPAQADKAIAHVNRLMLDLSRCIVTGSWPTKYEELRVTPWD